jgi:hypothetical protein
MVDRIPPDMLPDITSPDFYGKSPALPESDDLEIELKEVNDWVEDPLKVVARHFRSLTLEHITKMCTQMGKADLRDTMVQWAVAYLEGGDLPLKPDGRRF